MMPAVPPASGGGHYASSNAQSGANAQHPARASSRGGVPWIWIVIGAIVVIAIIAAVANRSSSTVEHVEHHHHDDDIRKAG